MPTTREEWLNHAIQLLRPHFTTKGYPLPANIRVSCGLPSTGALRTKKRTLGEVWEAKASKDEHHEIFISPVTDRPINVLSILAHELVHIAVGLKAGHRGKFPICAHAVGLIGPWTATKASNEFIDRLNDILPTLGKYPHAEFRGMTNRKKKQGTRLLKVFCTTCLYTMRITQSWIITGIPKCPNPDCDDYDGKMEVEIPE